MSVRSTTHSRRPFTFGAAVLISAAAFLVTTAGPVSAGRQQEFTVTPATAVVGDPVAATSDVPCFNYETDLTVEITVLDASDAEVFSTTGTLDAEFNWTAAIATSALDAGTYTVKARCVYGPESWDNYSSETLTLTAAETTTTTVVDETTTTIDDTTSTTAAPGTSAAPAVDHTAAAAPAGAVAASPSYTG